jgi:hypothetical protein
VRPAPSALGVRRLQQPRHRAADDDLATKHLGALNVEIAELSADELERPLVGVLSRRLVTEDADRTGGGCRRRSHKLLTHTCGRPGSPMDVLELIDELHDLVHSAKQVPLRAQVRVDAKKVHDLLDQMRSTIPDEIKQAQRIVIEREEMLAEAKREAERIVKEARERQTQLVAEHQLIRQAEREAEEIIENARAREREIRMGAEGYAAEILDTLELNLSKFIAAVQRGRERLRRPDEPGDVG